MPDTAPEPTAEPRPESPALAQTPPARRAFQPLPPLPWWFLGLVLGALAAAVVGGAGAIEVLRDPAPRGAHRATVRVFVRPARGETGVPDAELQRVAFLLREPAVLTRALAVPEVAARPTVGALRDPVPDLEQRLAVEITGSGVVSATLVGDEPQDLAAILEQIVAKCAEEYAALARKARDEQTTRSEKVATALRFEIDLQEKAIEMVNRANGTGDPGALLRDRLNRLETELAKRAPEFALLEHRVEALKKAQANGAPADPSELARAVDADPRVAPLLLQRADAAIALEKERAVAPGAATVKDLQAKLDRAEKALAGARAPVQKEVAALLRAAAARRAGIELEEAEARLAVAKSVRESVQKERDTTRQSLASAQATGASTEGMRRALVPLYEQAEKVTAQQAQLRADGSGVEDRIRVAGPAAVEPNRRPWRWGAPLGDAFRAFLFTFALVTAFQFTGLAFRALGHRG